MKYLVVVLLLVVRPVIAAPSINIQTNFYSVSGNDSKSIQQSIQKNGPVGKDGKTYHAVTKWDAQWSYRWVETGSFCQLTRVEVSLDVEYLLPELTKTHVKSEKFSNAWDQYFTALFKHEQQHKDYGVLAVNELEKELLVIQQRKTCAKLEDTMAKTAQKVLDKYDRIEKEFDHISNHGINQGVKLP